MLQKSSQLFAPQLHRLALLSSGGEGPVLGRHSCSRRLVKQEPTILEVRRPIAAVPQVRSQHFLVSMPWWLLVYNLNKQRKSFWYVFTTALSHFHPFSALHLKLTVLVSKSAKSKLKPCRQAPDSTSPSRSHDLSRLSVNATEASNHTPPFWAKTSTRNTSLICAGPTDVKREASEPWIKRRDSELKNLPIVCQSDSTWICQSGFLRCQLSYVVCTLGGKVGLSQYVKICCGIFEGPEISVMAVTNVGSNPDTVSTAIHNDGTKLMGTLSETVSVPTYFWYKADVPSSHSAWFMKVLKMRLGAKCMGIYHWKSTCMNLPPIMVSYYHTLWSGAISCSMINSTIISHFNFLATNFSELSVLALEFRSHSKPCHLVINGEYRECMNQVFVDTFRLFKFKG